MVSVYQRPTGALQIIEWKEITGLINPDNHITELHLD